MRNFYTLKKQWAKKQQLYDYPVDLLGHPIARDDLTMIKLWKEAGMDQYMIPAKPPAKRS